ncbi:MAG: CDP-alcohol phosphatidyltransferase family protein, partial [Chloroflexota bacterium]
MAQNAQQRTLSDRLRHRTADFTRNVGESVHRLGIHPDAVSMAALLLCVGAAVAIGSGRFVLAGWLVFWGGIFDVADGAVARARGQMTPYGAVLDSTLDRYAD